MTEWLHFHFSLSCIGEGNGNPLQCSCLENPRDGGAWWAAVYGVTQSWTWLKQLSSSSGSNITVSYAILFFTASDFASITRHIHNWTLFLLWLFILSGAISSLISSSILGTTHLGSSSFSVLYFCLDNPINSMKKQKDRTLKDELPRSVGSQYATGDQ